MTRCLAMKNSGYPCSKDACVGKFCLYHANYESKLKKKLKAIELELKRIKEGR